MPLGDGTTKADLVRELGQAHERAFGARADNALDDQIAAAAHAVWAVSQWAPSALEAEPDFIGSPDADGGAR